MFTPYFFGGMAALTIPLESLLTRTSSRFAGHTNELKQVVDGAAKAAMEAADEYTFSNVERIEKELTDQGITIIDLTPEQIHAFSDKTKKTWDMVKADVNPDVYDAFMAALKK